jgi:hypothetical protein
MVLDHLEEAMLNPIEVLKEHLDYCKGDQKGFRAEQLGCEKRLSKLSENLNELDAGIIELEKAIKILEAQHA